jgi:hypothetical protein
MSKMMDQNVTFCDSSDEALPPIQMQAIRRLLLGESIKDVASEIGVSRATIHRWRNTDFEFMASYNRHKIELAESIDTRLHQIASTALQTVEEAIKDGDPRIAISILKGCGFLDGRAKEIGSQSAEDLEEEAKKANQVKILRRDRLLGP